MIIKEIGIVDRITSIRGNAIELDVSIDGNIEKAIAYRNLTKDISPADSVLLNTTAQHKRLGTGGVHFVIANLTNPVSEDYNFTGHIVKCRYTPIQHTVLSVEEPDSPYYDRLKDAESIEGVPVIVGQLHSQISVAAAALKEMTDDKANIVYIMTDYSSLPLIFSKTVSKLKNNALINSTVTCGQAFGGDYEAVNIYTALLFAKIILKADYIIVAPGPGNVGTGTKFGFSSIDQGNVLNAVNILGGIPVCISRISFAEERERHIGISHHTITMLRAVANEGMYLAIPVLENKEHELIINNQLEENGLLKKHKVISMSGKAGFKTISDRNIPLITMERTMQETPEFFQSCSAAAELAYELVNKNNKE